MRQRILLSSLFVATVATVGCSQGASEPPSGEQHPAIGALPRALTAQEQRVQSAANAFTFTLWKQVNAAQPDGNVFASPLSASFALGMALNGAAGQTQAEMKAALHFDSLSLADVNAGYKSLMAFLPSLDKTVAMRVANSVWYRNTFAFNQAYLNTTRDVFSATVTPLDFADVSSSLGAINGWVDGATEHKIPAILDDIDGADVMFLINALYFKAQWRTKFDAALTAPAVFHAIGGDQQVPFMHRQGLMSYSETTGYQAVDLPYGDSAFTMTVILPNPGVDPALVGKAFTQETWYPLAAALPPRVVNLSLPKMQLTWERTLNDDLDALGMHLAFVGGQADFTGMSPQGDRLYISQVKQKAFVSVDEEGTEAAAATSVGVTITAMPVPVEMNVNRPFLFVIRERLTGTILFIGRVVKL